MSQGKKNGGSLSQIVIADIKVSIFFTRIWYLKTICASIKLTSMIAGNKNIAFNVTRTEENEMNFLNV